ncbi:N-(5'-phosphoribosyl)anthranilate isomerase [Planctomycetota bacterium]|nr:N-(5'-phosphoribosyl)anthranilate isomerase [Planctomycetota bacterium]
MRTRIKFCGLAREADVLAAVACGADAIGFNLARGPRRIPADRAAELARLVPPPVSVVLLFMDADPADITAAGEACRASAIQLHGQESADLADSIATRWPVIKAFAAGTTPSVIRAYPCAVALVDAPSGGGGTGHGWDYAALAGTDLGHPLMLAGGLTPSTVADAIRAARPWAVDVSSGIESSPGIKDPGKMAAFAAAVGAAG